MEVRRASFLAIMLGGVATQATTYCVIGVATQAITYCVIGIVFGSGM